MADTEKKQRDYTPEVDAILPDATSLATAGKLQDAVDKLLSLEKQTRNANDIPSTTRLAKSINDLCYDARDYPLLNSSINVLSKKHGQLKGVVQAIVEQAMGWLDDIKQKDGSEKWLELVETLRSITEGKIFLETPRARITLALALYHESLADSSSPIAPPKESLETAAELLSELQVETYSSMERREKTEFLLEQMRLFVRVASLKDAEVSKEDKDKLDGGEAVWVKVRVCGRKINEGFLAQPANEDLKLKYYDLMIQYGLHGNEYLNVAKHYHKLWDTPSIKKDWNVKGREALEHVIYYVILAPHDNEQSDMLHRVSNYTELSGMDLHKNLVKCFTTQELMRWPVMEDIYAPTLRNTNVFGPSEEKRWEDLHTRIIEHNVRVIAKYYQRVTMKRLISLLDLSPEKTEETLSRLVVSGTVWARIDRPAGIINFRNKKSVEEVMNDWSSDMQRLLGLVEKTWMGVNAAQAAQPRVNS